MTAAPHVNLSALVEVEKIQNPGFYRLRPEIYHADPCPAPSLSASIAKLMLEQSPAHARVAHPRLNPAFEDNADPKFDFGQAAHRIILGKGAELLVIEHDSYRTKAAQQERDDARRIGCIPILVADHERALEMAEAFYRQLGRFPAELNQRFADGTPEVVIAWQEGALRVPDDDTTISVEMRGWRGLHLRTLKCLAGRTVGQVRRTPDADLLAIPEFGRMGLNQFREIFGPYVTDLDDSKVETPGFWCRGMCDRLWIGSGAACLFDFKSTSASAEPNASSRRIFDLGFDLQAAFYRRGINALQPGIERFNSVILTQENEPPYALSAVTLSYEAWELADKKVLAALALWERCMATGDWPAYPPYVATADLPAYVESAWVNREMNDELLNRLDVGRFARPLPEKAGKPVNYLAAG